ncbi:MAG: hypothetical protein HKN21_12660 [Candidatus Eisenbacteria bacterium]|uniref:Radical SAM protein n=1 Tax=Eiseniibacteriota bacterium TaxID=2212470 RepID=A0A7Y2E9B8_UNCEI|nr:hypothetical protein [Candidatus Eisenbacteria bacterium]
MNEPLNPCELEIDLFCKGLRIGQSCLLEKDGRVVSRTRAGLGSGLEIVIPGGLKDIWMNAPVEEDFVLDSPYILVKEGDHYKVRDDRSKHHYEVRIPEEPKWVRSFTSMGTPMHKVGVLQGTYLGIYISNSCSFWYHKPTLGCKFCTTGLNVGVNEMADKDIKDVVEVCWAAKEESGATFVHLNSGFAGKDLGLDNMAPYVAAIKEKVGLMVGVQVTPSPNLWKYDWLIDCGVDHFSFCYEFHNPDIFAELCPGKEQMLGQQAFFNALEYTAKKMGKGRVSGEIIAGVEPIEDTLRAIDYITGVGAFPTVCIFRPTIGADMEYVPPPKYEDMRHVMEYMWNACRKNDIPIGLAPNIEVSLIVNPDDARYLPKHDMAWKMYEGKLKLMRTMAAPLFKQELKRRNVKGNPHEYPEGSPEPVMPRTEAAEAIAREAGVGQAS